MRIGITYQSSASLFDSGANQTAWLLMEIYTSLGHDLVMMDRCNADRSIGWNEMPPLPQGGSVQWVNAYQARGLDHLIDIDGQLPSMDRVKASKESIVFLRGFLQFSELETVAYIENAYVPRSFDQIKEVWCWDILNPERTLPSVALLFPCPIRRIPFAWSSTIIRHMASTVHASSMYLRELPWTVHVSEKNRMNQSTSVIPLVAIREMTNQRLFSHGTRFLVHGMEHLQENRFLKENVTDNLDIQTLPLSFVPSTPFSEWIRMPNQILLSHSRFLPLRLGLLNALWLGIPIIHNSPLLQDIHPLLKKQYYTGNNLSELLSAMKGLIQSPEEWYGSIHQIRNAIETRYAWKKEDWSALWSALPSFPPSLPSPSLPSPSLPPSASLPCSMNEIRIAFSDMWPGFNPMNNYFTDALRHEYPEKKISGFLYSASTQADLLLFGPYGKEWKSAPSTLPRIFFSAENWPIETDPSISLYLTPSREEDHCRMRVPTWATFIDWFSNQTTMPTEGTDNPIRLPLHLAMTPHPVPFSARKEFCGFVVSNPVCEFRNETFHAVNAYKTVHSGGGLYNNIGERLELKYPGGGCGDISKHHFFSKHQFTISFENSQSPGYLTEKLIHAKMAGCVPLYWGDEHAEIDVVPQSFINLSAIKDPKRVVEVIQKLEQHPAMCETIASTPIVNEEKKNAVLQQMSKMCRKLVSLIRPPTSWMEKVERTYVINLPTREDRWKSLLAAHPELNHSSVERRAAVHGKTLELNQTIYQLFQHNEFHWKKSVMGCSMSHMATWSAIQAREKDPEDTWYLILEDDVRFTSEWRSIWNKSLAPHIPQDADVLYLGGVLPPNQPALPLALEPMSSDPVHWSRIKPNTFFSKVPMPVFHFCAYSYLLTKRGARKLLQGILQSERKAYTGIDHLVNHPQYGLSIYIATPLIAHCFQEDDPAYLHSNFNDLSRKDQFDSDIWNNTECFTEKEIEPFRSIPTPSTENLMEVYHEPTEENKPFELYETKWLEFLFGKKIGFTPFSPDSLKPNAWYLVQRPHGDRWNERFKEMNQQGIPFRVLHVSDEFLSDPIDFYSFEQCKAVIRNYPRDVPSQSHILTVPLGYHHVAPSPNVKSWTERELIWSFHGTDWFRRGQILEPFTAFVPYSCHLQPEWNHSTKTKENQYLSHLGNSKFCPIIKGNHYETFRLYEALEAGTLPITTITDMNYLSWIDDHLHLEEYYPWNKPMEMLKRSGENWEEVRQKVQQRWKEWKMTLAMECRRLTAVPSSSSLKP